MLESLFNNVSGLKSKTLPAAASEKHTVNFVSVVKSYYENYRFVIMNVSKSFESEKNFHFAYKLA